MTAGGVVSAALLLVSSGNPTLAGSSTGDDQIQLNTSEADFYQPGTQPNGDSMTFDQIVGSSNCTFCHGEFNVETAPYDPWVSSMMGQSARDPVWHAALSIANQDVKFGGETCIRCHAPRAWLSGKSFTTESFDIFTEFDAEDFDGINCNFCHRAVNPVPCDDYDPDHPENCYVDGMSAKGFPPASGDFSEPYGEPYPDSSIIGELTAENLHERATYVVDLDMRRGPYGPTRSTSHGTASTARPTGTSSGWSNPRTTGRARSADNATT